MYIKLGVGFKNLLFSSLLVEDEPILTNILKMGWFNHQLSTAVGRLTLPVEPTVSVGDLHLGVPKPLRQCRGFTCISGGLEIWDL